MKYIRLGLAYLFFRLSDFFAPKNWDVDEHEEVAPSNAKKEVPVPFTDLATYFEVLKKPHSTGSALISICNNLREISFKKKIPTRLSFVETAVYDGSDESDTSVNCYVGGFENNRWFKFGNVVLGLENIFPLVEEMITAMAVDGWSCMNDSVDQINNYVEDCISSNEEYVIERCKALGVKGTIRTSVYLIVDVNAGQKSRSVPSPKIIVKIAVSVNGEGPVQSEHHVHFHRKHLQKEKSEA